MKYFTIHELTTSTAARERNIPNNPTPEHIQNLVRLVGTVLDPLREQFGSAIKVTSGYRSALLNTAVGGAKNSHHCKGMAVDIVALNGNNARLFEIIRYTLPYTQLIWEKGNNKQPLWVHVSFDPFDVRKETLKTKDGKNYTRIV